MGSVINLSIVFGFVCVSYVLLVRLKEHSSNDKRGGGGRGGGGFYLSAHISQSIHPGKLNLVLNDREQKP